MTVVREQVANVLDALTIGSTTEYSWFGTREGALPARTRSRLTDESARDYQLYSVENRLYADFYCPGGARPTRSVDVDPLAVVTPFAERLSEANAGSGCWESGWMVHDARSDCIVVAKAGLRLRAPHDACKLQDARPALTGAPVELRVPKELAGALPGFYMALGDNELDTGAESPPVRFYFNLVSTGAIPFVSLLTSVLNAERLAFRLKVLNDPRLFSRCDAGVVYVRKDDYSKAAPMMRAAYASLERHLQPGTPAFTKQLSPGLGLAEDPGHASGSFGQHRCRLLAFAIVNAHQQHLTRTSDRLAVVDETFREAGLSLDAPYLNAGSRDDYRF